MPKRRMKGVVVSDKMDKTVVVKVEKIKLHPIFRKQYKIHKKYKAHDPQNKCKQGDVVVIEETRPLSKEKRWRVIKIVKSSYPEDDKIEKDIPENNSEDKEKKIVKKEEDTEK